MVKTGLSARNFTPNGRMSIAPALYHWIDLFWVPVALVTMEKGKRLLTSFFVLACVLLLRLQMELLRDGGYGRGILGLMESDIYPRGLATYSVFIMLFLLLAYFSKGAHKAVHMAASITILIASFCVSTLVMVL